MVKPAIASPGLIWCAIFLILDALQAVYFGHYLQLFDSFLVGGLVFGLTAVAALAYTAVAHPGQYRLALIHAGVTMTLNLSVAGAWASYLLAVQLIEPAICFAIFSGLVPLVTYVAHRLGIKVATPLRGALEAIGVAVIALALLGLALVSLAGWSSFTKAIPFAAVLGVLLAIIAGILITVMLLCNQRLDQLGIGPLAQYGLRFPLYLLLCLVGWALGWDAKGAVDLSALTLVICAGFILLALPIYAVQRAVALVDAMTIAIIAATAPVLIFLFQLVEGRVDMSLATLCGLALYYFGAILAAIGRSFGYKPAEPC